MPSLANTDERVPRLSPDRKRMPMGLRPTNGDEERAPNPSRDGNGAVVARDSSVFFNGAAPFFVPAEVRKRARNNKQKRFTTVLHDLTTELLRQRILFPPDP